MSDTIRLGPGLFGLLLAGLALATWPLSSLLPGWAVVAVAAIGLWRLWAELQPGRAWSLGRRQRLVLLIGMIAALALTGSVGMGLDGGAPMLVVFLWTKLAELRRLRDVLWCATFAFVLAGIGMLADQSLASGLAALAAMVLLLAAATAAHSVCPGAVDAVRPEAGMPGSDRPVPQAVVVRRAALGPAISFALVMMAAAAPLAVALFVVLPRPAVGLRPPVQRSGITDQLDPGGVSALAKDQRLALRVTWLDGQPPPPAERYFRGVVLWRTDGRSWSVGASRWLSMDLPTRPVGAGKPSRPVRYEVAVEAAGLGRRAWVFLLDAPVVVVRDAQVDAGGTQVFSSRRNRYEAVGDSGVRLADTDLLRNASEAPPADPQIVAFARQLRPAGTSAAETIDRLLAWFAEQGYTYSLTPGDLGDDPVKTLMLTGKKGFCEHYAAATAVILRLADIPTRVVVGYHGGEDNAYGGFTTIRQAHAHAWVEAWLDGVGWLRIDPTSALTRIDPGTPPPPTTGGTSAAAVAAAEAEQADWLRPLRQSWDWVEWRWYRSVVNWDRESQRSWFRQLGLGGLGGWALLALALAVGTVVAVASGWLLVRLLTSRETDPARRALADVERRLARLGLGRNQDEGPIAWAERIGRERAELAADLSAASAAYARWSYGRISRPEDLSALEQARSRLVRQMRQRRDQSAPTTGS